jgi:hypothetical protein
MVEMGIRCCQRMAFQGLIRALSDATRQLDIPVLLIGPGAAPARDPLVWMLAYPLRKIRLRLEHAAPQGASGLEHEVMLPAGCRVHQAACKDNKVHPLHGQSLQ